MLPAYFVGTVVSTDGPTPFVLRTATGEIERGRWISPDRGQAMLAPDERAAAERRVRQLTSAAEVRLGDYCCPCCGRWFDVVARPGTWRADRCAACARGRAAR